ncbi:MAG: hypothetical protein JNK12_04085 [Acidimicrobiales bacterium]|nr:hypothetical protein [Acidimicrobiales bacterium]
MKHAYAILWAEAQVGRAPLGTWVMAELLMCDQHTARQRVQHLEDLGLLEVDHGQSIYNGDERDVPTSYRVTVPHGRAARSDPPHTLVLITSLYQTTARERDDPSPLRPYLRELVMRGLGPQDIHPDEGRWAASVYGPVGWLMTQTGLPTFTASDMARAVGCGIGRKAVERVRDRMCLQGDAVAAPGLGRGVYTLTLKVWLLRDLYDELLAYAPDAPEPGAVMDLLSRVVVADESARQAKYWDRKRRQADQREAGARLKLLRELQAARAEPEALPRWTEHYTLSCDGWTRRPSAPEHMIPLVPLDQTWSVEP